MSDNRRDIARQHFSALGLTYEDINMNSIYQLCKILNKHIISCDRDMLVMINEPVLKGKNKNIILNKNNTIEFAEIKIRGTYFADREAVTFNTDGFIGFCGWADDINTQIITDGFIEWCNDLAGRKIENGN